MRPGGSQVAHGLRDHPVPVAEEQEIEGLLHGTDGVRAEVSEVEVSLGVLQHVHLPLEEVVSDGSASRAKSYSLKLDRVRRRLESDQIVSVFIVYLEIGNGNGRGILQGVEEELDCPRDYPAVAVDSEVAGHRVRLAGAGLTVGEDGSVVSGQNTVRLKKKTYTNIVPFTNTSSHSTYFSRTGFAAYSKTSSCVDWGDWKILLNLRKKIGL